MIIDMLFMTILFCKVSFKDEKAYDMNPKAGNHT